MPTATSEALLALIIDDSAAMQVLAGWAALGIRLDQIDSKIDDIADLVGFTVERTRECLRKLRAARVLEDGGITDLADRMLQTVVKTKITQGRKPKR